MENALLVGDSMVETLCEVEFVDTAEGLEKMLGDISGFSEIGIDLEGEKLSKDGEICIMQISTGRHSKVYLIDVYNLRDRAFCTNTKHGSLQQILENPNILKYIWDVRCDCNALFHIYNIRLQNVSDLQLWEVACRYLHDTHNTRFLNGLASAIERSTDASLSLQEQNRIMVNKLAARCLFAPANGGSFAIWKVRPLPPVLIEYCTDSRLLFTLKKVYTLKIKTQINYEDNVFDMELVQEAITSATQRRMNISCLPNYSTVNESPCSMRLIDIVLLSDLSVALKPFKTITPASTVAPFCGTAATAAAVLCSDGSVQEEQQVLLTAAASAAVVTGVADDAIAAATSSVGSSVIVIENSSEEGVEELRPSFAQIAARTSSASAKKLSPFSISPQPIVLWQKGTKKSFDTLGTKKLHQQPSNVSTSVPDDEELGVEEGEEEDMEAVVVLGEMMYEVEEEDEERRNYSEEEGQKAVLLYSKKKKCMSCSSLATSWCCSSSCSSSCATAATGSPMLRGSSSGSSSISESPLFNSSNNKEDEEEEHQEQNDHVEEEEGGQEEEKAVDVLFFLPPLPKFAPPKKARFKHNKVITAGKQQVLKPSVLSFATKNTNDQQQSIMVIS